MLKVNVLTMDYGQKMEGITHVPQFGWKLESNQRNCRQNSYHLQIGLDSEFKNCIYDSGEVRSEESAHVEVRDMELKSLTRYFVRVKVVDNYGEESAWSKPVSFLTALCKNEWKGEFISAEKEEDGKSSKGTCVRKEIFIDKPVKSAYVMATSLGLYRLYINGEKVGKDEMTPGWTSYHKHLLYQTYDVRALLSKGNNTIGAMLAAGWYKGNVGFAGFRNHYGTRTAFLGQLHIRYEDGTEEIWGTDDSWKCSDAPIVFSELYDGEIYDARKEISGWNKCGLDDSNWKKTQIVPYDKSILCAQGACKIRKIEEVKPKRLFVTPKGETVIDFGQNMTGWVEFRAKGKEGDKVDLNCFEVLDAEGNMYLENLRGAKERITYLFGKEEEIVYHPYFSFQGFQFVRIIAYPGIPDINDFTAYAVHSEMERTGEFECSNPEINQLQHNILWGMKGNFLDVPTDCPQRDERLGWTGDAQIFAQTANYLMNTYVFFQKWLIDLAADQTEEGGVPHVIPDVLTGKPKPGSLVEKGTDSAAAWADAAVIIPWMLYQAYGDKKILRQQYGSMKRWIDFMHRHSNDYIWNYKLQFGDWVALDAQEGSFLGATPNDLTCTAYFAYTTGLFVKISEVLKETQNAVYYSELRDNIIRKYQNTFFDKNGKLTAQTQTAHIVSLYFNLTPEEYKETTIEGLKKLLKKENGHLVTGFVGTPYFCHALSQNGCTKEAYELLLKDDFPSWLYQVKKGATTIWEHWDGLKPDGTMWAPKMNSFNHYAYGAVGAWLYRVVAGIEIDEENPGYKHIIIQPHMGGNLTSAVGRYQSVYGKVESSWCMEGNTVSLKIKIPVNTSASLKLERVEKILEADGIEIECVNSKARAEFGSGTYCIRYRRTAE